MTILVILAIIVVLISKIIFKRSDRYVCWLFVIAMMLFAIIAIGEMFLRYDCVQKTTQSDIQSEITQAKEDTLKACMEEEIDSEGWQRCIMDYKYLDGLIK